MKSKISYAHATVLAITLWLAGGCSSLIDPDIASFDLSIGSKDFTVDTANQGVDDPGALASLTCNGIPDACETAAAAACPEGQCTATCNTATDSCDVAIAVTLTKTIDLAKERPEIAKLDAKAFVEVAIEALEYQIADNTLNVATPEFTLYVAPSNVLKPDDPLAKLVGTIPSAPAQTSVPITDMVASDEGLGHLSDAMLTFKTPFNFIMTSTLLVTKSTPVPAGAATARVIVTASASL